MAQVGVVFVSHSDKIATGLVELARQMAPTAPLAAAGGTDDGGIGTSFERVTAAIADVDRGSGVVVIGDLGSAILTAETALDMLDPDIAALVRVLDVPLVEGGVAAAVAAESGGDLQAVVTAAGGAPHSADAARGVAVSAEATPADAAGDPVTGSATLVNAAGLHARPAAAFVRLASRFDAAVQVNGADAKSLLSVLGLGLRQGDVVHLSSTGNQANDAVDALKTLIESGFDEPR